MCALKSGKSGIQVFLALIGLASTLSAAEPRQSGTAAATPHSSDPSSAVLAREVREKGWVVYGARTPKGDWDLYTMRPDGSDMKNLTNTPDFNEGLARFSADGTKILYRRTLVAEPFDNNRHGMQGQLVFMSSDGTGVEVFGKVGEFPWASWSPDGRKLACLSPRGIDLYDIATRTVEAHMDRKGTFQQMMWSPDGKWLTGVANSYGTGWSVVRIEVASGAINPVSKVDCCTPDWFPDSRTIIYSYRPHDWTQLWMADGGGENRRLILAEDGRHVYGGCVSPDGNYVLFTGNKEEDGDPLNSGAPMGLLRLRDAPMVIGSSPAARKEHPIANDGPVLVLPPGWEPHWTSAKTEATK